MYKGIISEQKETTASKKIIDGLDYISLNRGSNDLCFVICDFKRFE